jgi:hypothetical protein
MFALAQHLEHRDRTVTDIGYFGTDYAIHREIETEVLEQSVSVLKRMRSAPQLGGRAGRELLTTRQRFLDFQ